MVSSKASTRRTGKGAGKGTGKPAGDRAAERAAAVVDESVFSPLPIGARDLLPVEARRRRILTHALLDGFERWGYREVLPPLIEYDEVLGRGLGGEDRERCVRFVEAGTGQLVALRSDVTPQIARLVAQRVGGSVKADDGLRLCYAATLVRLPSGRHDRAELHQVGLEFVGEADPTADAELIGLCDEALVGLGLTGHRFDLSHSGVVRDAFAFLGLGPALERELRRHLERKDRAGLVQLLTRHGVEGKTSEAFAALADLHGPPSVLAAAKAKLRTIGAGAALEHLREVVDAVTREHPGVSARLLIDLGEVRGLDYYTGVRLRVWAPGVGGPVVRGGRYDDLVSRYGAGLPATGLAIDLDALEQALEAAELGVAGAELGPARLVAVRVARTSKALTGALRATAVREAGAARSRGLRAWIDGERDLEAAQAQADRRGAQRLSWLFVDGRGASAEIVRQRHRRTKSGWRMESETRTETS